MDVTPDELTAWIAEGEGRRLEFKRGMPRDERVARTLCAFANTRGGILLIGVTDRGHVEHVARPREVMGRLRAICKSLIAPPLKVELRTVQVEGAQVVCCSVPLSPARPHAARRADGSDEVVVRVGASNRVAKGATLRSLAATPARRGLEPLERQVLEWVESQTGGGRRAEGGATVEAFARAKNVGRQRARRAFTRLEQAGRLVAHGTGAKRSFSLP